MTREVLEKTRGELKEAMHDSEGKTREKERGVMKGKIVFTGYFWIDCLL